ncbi:MAG: translocation/assembly module TamB domain-containing protein, partial [Gemmatimonadota bacterium]
MTRTQRALVYVVAGIATGLLVALMAVLAMSRTEFGMERARRFAIGWLAERVDGEVQVGSIGGRGLLGGLTLRDMHIIDKRGRPFMRIDSAIIAYNWRTLARGQIVIEHATLFNPEIYFEQLPGDSIWNYQHVFPDRRQPGAAAGPPRLIRFDEARVVNGSAVVRIPFESATELAEAGERTVIDTVPGGFAKVMRFDSLHGELSRVIWESPIEPGRLFDVRTMRGRGFVWREPMHVTGLRGTITIRDTVVAFDVPDFRLPSSRAGVVGRVVMEEGMNFFDVRVDMRNVAFRDLDWLYPRLPDNGGGTGVLRIQSQRPRGILWLVTDTRLAGPGTRLAGSFGVVTGADSLYFTNVDLRASPLNLDLIQQIVPNKLPIDGLLVGTVEVEGGLSSLDTRGDLQIGSSGVKWRGRLDVRAGLGAQNFRADMQTLDLAILNALRPDLRLRGQVTGHVEASGNLQSGVQFAADIHHYLSGFTSSFAGTGTYTGGTAPGLDIELNARPLSLEELAKTYPALERLRGEARGPIRLFGALDDLAVKADLETQGGRALIDGRLTRTAAKPRYSGQATLLGFRLDELIADLPQTTLNGKAFFDVTGSSVLDAAGRVTGRFTGGSVRGVEFTNAHTALTLDRGVARFDTLTGSTAVGAVTANGSIGLNEERSGTLTFALRNDSTTGNVRAEARLTGSIQAFDLAANLEIENLNVHSIASERITARLSSERGSDSYTLSELTFGHRNQPWRLIAPAHLAIDDHGLTTDTLEVRRADGGRVRAAGRIAWHDASHTPEPGQISDFRLDFDGVPFAEFALAAAGVSNVRGTVSGSVRVSGNAVAPLLNADAAVTGFMLGAASLDNVTASLTYADQRIRARVDADKAGRRVLFADGTIPVNLAFVPLADRKLGQPLRFSIQADSLPATFLTASLDGFRDVRGRVDGNLLATGTTARPQLNGALTLKDGSAAWDVSGVRYRAVDGTIRLESERIARVDASVKANGGSGRVTGTIDLEQLRNPGFDLALQAQNFLAARRRDAEFTASGNVQLRGRYRQPIMTGAIAVDHGALYLDELYRRFQIVELEDPLLYDVVDTSLVSLPTILRTQNPFVKNLVVQDLRVDVGREAWLRSRDLNVEVSGGLTIAFLLTDTLLAGARSAEDLRLTGTLRAARGTYQLAGPGISRRFAIREGTIEFPGTPGVDPGLAFNAVYRARSSRRELIDIIAVVSGTLRNPQIRLTSDEETLISESDLASYLFFGLPTYELTASQSAAVDQARAGFSPEVLGFAASSGFGYLANSLQAFAQNYGLLDYVSLTAAETIGIQSRGAIADLFAGTRLELGRYVGRDGNVYIAYSQSLTASG